MSADPHKLEETGVAIVGVGLIGGSIGAALKARGFTGPILGFGRNPERLEQAKHQGLIDRTATSPEQLSEVVSLVVVCTPVDRIAQDVRSLATHAEDGTVFTDGGSVKQQLCEALCDVPNYLGAHPMAGSEKTGFENADKNLFQDRVCILTPEAQHDEQMLARVTRFWEFLGMKTRTLSPVEHDRAVAFASHLPHLIAAALSQTLPEQYREFVGGGFRDSTRIAAGDPGLWNAIFQGNRDHLNESLEQFLNILDQFRNSVNAADSADLITLLEQAKSNRDQLE